MPDKKIIQETEIVNGEEVFTEEFIQAEIDAFWEQVKPGDFDTFKITTIMVPDDSSEV